MRHKKKKKKYIKKKKKKKKKLKNTGYKNEPDYTSEFSIKTLHQLKHHDNSIVFYFFFVRINNKISPKIKLLQKS